MNSKGEQTPSDWYGRLAQVARGQPEATVKAPVRVYNDGTRATLFLTDTREKFWVKAVGNPQGTHVLVNETVIARLAKLIDAPARPTKLIRVTEAFSEWSPGGGFKMRPGTAHGSLHLEHAEERDEIVYQRRADNARRIARLFALWDWCMGDDAQWMYDQADDFAIWSFDHGFWFGGDDGDWTPSILERIVDRDWAWEGSFRGVDPAELRAVAERLRRVTDDQILRALAGVPSEWGTEDAALETLGWCLSRRREPVARRLGEIAAALE